MLAFELDEPQAAKMLPPSRPTTMTLGIVDLTHNLAFILDEAPAGKKLRDPFLPYGLCGHQIPAIVSGALFSAIQSPFLTTARLFTADHDF